MYKINFYKLEISSEKDLPIIGAFLIQSKMKMLYTSILVFSPLEIMYYFSNRVVFGTNKIKHCSKFIVKKSRCWYRILNENW